MPSPRRGMTRCRASATLAAMSSAPNFRLSCRFLCRFLVPFWMLLVAGCGEVWNDPYPSGERGQSILYSAFTERPKHLDPVQSYTEDEITFTAQVYEPPLQYHFLKRPYELVPLTAAQVPIPTYYDKGGRRLPNDAPIERIAESVYEIRLQPGIRYQPHPAFAVDEKGEPRYRNLDREKLGRIERIADFEHAGSRELRADDYIYEIKRLAHPRLHSPIFGMMAEHIVGLKELGKTLQDAAKGMGRDEWLDLDKYALTGVEKVDDLSYRVRLKGKYPQFLYWLAMPFFAPVPREVDRFYSQPGMVEKNLTLDWYPVGTGPYMLVENNPNSRMVLARNPNYRGETYPCEGEEGDRAAGLLDDCGKTLPFIERAVFSREKEAIPYWNKFLQGWYDASGISSDSFDQAVRINVGGDVALTEEMQQKGIRLITSVRSSTFYMGFNMLDAVVGGDAHKLRQAVSIVLDQEEFISIFMNGRGIPAQGPLPPGIFGHVEGEEGINKAVYEWRDGAPRRRSVDEAKKLLAEAGWPDGRNAKSGEPLVLNLDTTSGGMGDKARLDWLTRQFAKIDIQLVVRATDFNRFQEKLRKGAVQLYFLGWNADYPDPENFFFLLHGGEGSVDKGGENKSNYRNPEFDRLFAEMKNMENTPRRLQIVKRMNRILHDDAPWIYAFHPKSYALGHAWLKNRKPSDVGHNNLKYQRIDVPLREAKRREWNPPVLWPLFALVVAISALIIPAVLGYRRRQQAAAR